MNRINIIAFLVIAFALSSCMLGPDFQKMETESHDKYRFAEEPTDTVINLQWWELFSDKVLVTLIDSALENNKDVRIAASKIEESRIYLGYTKADMYPNFSYGINSSYGNQYAFLMADGEAGIGLSATANMNWEIDFWGKYRRSTEAAKAEMLASQFGLRTVQVSIITEVSNAYYALLDFKRRLSIAERTLESRKESTNIIQQRFDQGTVPELDLNQAQIQEEIAAGAIPTYERFVAYTENALRVLTGELPSEVVVESTIKEQLVPPTIPVGLPAQLLARRPDVLSAEQAVVAQNAKIGVAQAMRLPAISLTAMGGLASANLSAFNAADAMGSIGVGLFGPIFNFGKNKRRVEIEEERTKQAKLNYEQTVLSAFRQTEDALVNINTLERELVTVERQYAAAKNAATLSRARYDGGVTSYLEVLDSERQLFQIELYHSELLQRRLGSYTNIYKVLGGGWISEEEMNQQ